MDLQDVDNYPYFDLSERIVHAIANQVQSTNLALFRNLVAYNCTKVASLMRAKIDTHHSDPMPINMYVINFAPSGSGKDYSTNIVENRILKRFKQRYLTDVVSEVSDKSLKQLACSRAAKKGTDPDKELPKVRTEYEKSGEFVYSFDSGTTPAIKQFRHKLLMGNIGSLNLEMNEVGSNLLGNTDVLDAFLELYDVGRIKQKLVKNTLDNVRNEEIDGITPANMILYGTPTKIFNGSKTEEEFISFIEAGYGRRCFFSFTNDSNTINSGASAAELYEKLTNPDNNKVLNDMADHFEMIADTAFYDMSLQISKELFIEWLSYKMLCESEAAKLGEYEELRKAELQHRHNKAFKLAGAYAFVSGSATIEEEHLRGAIRLAQDSGKAFNQMLIREPAYVKLAKYLSQTEVPTTQADLMEKLPFYKGTANQRNEMYNLASAWAYSNCAVLTKSYVEGIEFLKGESLKVTDLSKMILSHSADFAADYESELASFDELDNLFQIPNYNWCNHHFLNNHRCDENTIAGVNLVILDIDNGTTLLQAQQIFKEYKYYMYTTKRHTEDENRFRLVLPLSHTLKLSKEDYNQFMSNIAEYFPLEADDASKQRSKKWLTHPDNIIKKLDGNLLDALMFIPRSNKSDKLKAKLKDMANLDSVERWFLNNTGEGNRSNQLIKYAYFLIDCGLEEKDVLTAITDLNHKLVDSLSGDELCSTIFKTVSAKFFNKD